jgi:lysophospholipase L1-like esterase
LILLGDSLTEASPDALARPRRWFTRGISGDRVRHVHARLGVSALDTRCLSVALLVGSNDLVNDGVDPSEVAEQTLWIVKDLRSAGKQVILSTVPPTRGAYDGANSAIRERNDRLQKLDRTQLRLANLHAAVPDEGGRLAERYSLDGLHLPEGASRLEEALGSRADTRGE